MIDFKTALLIGLFAVSIITVLVSTPVYFWWIDYRNRKKTDAAD